jgi:hypothetical protein
MNGIDAINEILVMVKATGIEDTLMTHILIGANVAHVKVQEGLESKLVNCAAANRPIGKIPVKLGPE